MNTEEREKLNRLIEDVLGWDFAHLTYDCANGREFYLALKRLEEHYETSKKRGS